MVTFRHAPLTPTRKGEASSGVGRSGRFFSSGAIRAALALLLASGAVARLRAEDTNSPGVPARVFSLYNDRVYILEVGYVESGGFRPDVSFTPFFRTLNPAFAQNGTPDEIAAAADKVLITQADWLNSRKETAPAAAAEPGRLPASARIYTIAGISYVALRTGESSQVEAVVGNAPGISETPRVARDPAVPTPGGNFMYWQ
jgi:hypothetical protein